MLVYQKAYCVSKQLQLPLLGQLTQSFNIEKLIVIKNEYLSIVGEFIAATHPPLPSANVANKK